MMPNIQTTKKRLQYEIFKAVVTSQSIAISSGINYITPGLFAHCLVSANTEKFSSYFERKNVDNFLSFLLAASVEKKESSSKKKSGNIVVNKLVANLVSKSFREPEKFGPENVFYSLISGDEKLRNIAVQFNITPDEVLKMINREGNKQNGTQQNAVRDVQQNENKKVNGLSKSEVVNKCCIDFTQRAKDGLISPVFCRQDEMEQILVSLMKKNKANPLLIGDPGVGKTAIVEGLAEKFAKNEVPERLKGYRVVALQLSSLVQGTTLRGQFEEKLDEVIKFVVKEKNIILFIDEIHTIIGAGSGDVGLDAGNIMKPYLARGEIKCIGATTFEDYYKYMRKDKALSRRFQRIFISEPEDSKTVEIIKGLCPALEKYHGCKINEDVFEYIVYLCKRFISDRFFPDKAIDCLDHACAKSSLKDGIVTKKIIDEVISHFSDVPINLVRQGDLERVEGLESVLKSELLGNDSSISEFCNKMKFIASTKGNKKGVLASIALYGPSGVGKRTVVRMAADYLYGRNSIISINGAEYSESHSISRIMGSPPGYVGHEEETYILREVRKKPHVFIMIQNPTLMHPSVMEQFRNIMENGTLTDVHGMIADFSNCIMAFVVDITGKAGDSIGFSGKSFSNNSYYESFSEIKKKFSFFNSINYCIGFNDVDASIIPDLVELEVKKFKNELENCGIIIECDDLCMNLLKSRNEITPFEIRRKTREELENIVSKNAINKLSKYLITVENESLRLA